MVSNFLSNSKQKKGISLFHNMSNFSLSSSSLVTCEYALKQTGWFSAFLLIIFSLSKLQHSSCTQQHEIYLQELCKTHKFNSYCIFASDSLMRNLMLPLFANLQMWLPLAIDITPACNKWLWISLSPTVPSLCPDPYRITRNWCLRYIWLTLLNQVRFRDLTGVVRT